VQILNSVVRHFQFGIFHKASTNCPLLIEDTIASDNFETGVAVAPTIGSGTVKVTLSRITANNNNFGVAINVNTDTTIVNSVLSNNTTGLQNSSGGNAWLAKTMISGNGTGVVAGPAWVRTATATITSRTTGRP
jgi:hypothetical protein